MSPFQKTILSMAPIWLFPVSVIAAESPETMFYDFQVTVTKGDKFWYGGDVWIAHDGKAILNNVSEVPMDLTCPATNKYMVATYSAGLYVELAIGREDYNSVHVDGFFKLLAARSQATNSDPCDVFVERYEQKFAQTLKEQELASAQDEPYTMTVKFIGSSPALPPERIAGRFNRNRF